jgi:hypothetical protein
MYQWDAGSVMENAKKLQRIEQQEKNKKENEWCLLAPAAQMQKIIEFMYNI